MVLYVLCGVALVGFLGALLIKKPANAPVFTAGQRES
jgi:hypothetical protein